MTLLLLHTELSKASFEAVAAAKQLGSFTIGLVGAEVQDAANALAGAGADRILAVQGTEFAQPRYSTDAAAAEALVKAAGADVILAPMTSRWARAVPGVAQRVGGRVDTHVVAIQNEANSLVASRWYYRQRIETTLSRAARPWFLLLDGGVAQPWAGAPGSAKVEMAPVEVPATRTEVLGVEELASDQQTIRPEAQLLFVAGAGWTKKQKDGQVHVGDAEKLILGFVSQARASLGSSKSLVDLSGEGEKVLTFLTHMHQVGQTGATPRHPKGLATCCHGEEPHVVGWRFIGERRAINLDANCGWARGKADVLYVADAFEVMAKLNSLLG
jgi:electron transfer flavoprotein alpha subunit